jgi:hypothetical protein
MKKAVANKEEPVYAGYLLFIQNPASQSNYKMQGPMEMVGRNPTVGQATYDNDANAAHQNAVMWTITGDTAYAKKAVEILNAWSATLKSITGRDAVLMAGLGPFKMVLAAEIIRYTYAGWTAAEIRQTEQHFREVIYPVLEHFALFANGNWDAAALKTVMAIGVFCNDRSIFESALRYYTNGSGNGRLTHYVINDTGQIQESGRDQAHTQLGIGMLAECCEIAWHQGLDLYGYENNRLLKGFEYVAKYNLGNEVPFRETLDRTGKYHHTKIATQERGALRAVYEQVYNHYDKRMGIAVPFTQQAAEKIRPEGPGRPGADHPGYGTFFYTRPALHGRNLVAGIPAPPAAVYATGTTAGNSISWIAPIGATSYTISRAAKKEGPYTITAANVRVSVFTDRQIKAGSNYYYTVAASNAAGKSGNAFPVGITAGLPVGWMQQDMGTVPVAGTSSFDGEAFLLEGAGMGMAGLGDSYHYTYKKIKGDGTITARFVPQPSSQFSRIGLLFGESTAANAPLTALLLYPGKTGQDESPDWQVRLLTRDATGKIVKQTGPATLLKAPAVTWSRLTGYLWLRLQKKGKLFTGFISYDGATWTPAGSVELSLNSTVLAGLSVASGMKNSTAILFDNVSIITTNK